MKLAVWSGLGRIGPYVTGVGKHIVHITRGLAARDEFDVHLLLAAEHGKAHASNHSPLARIPGTDLPFKRRQLEALWRTVHAPAIDRWAGGADWIYCPKETYVPVRNARYAITVHDLYALEEIRTDVSSLDRRRRARLLKRALDESTVVFAVSEFTKGRIVELLGIPPEKIRVVGNGVEEGFFQVPTSRNAFGAKPNGRKYVLSVGGLTRKKGAPNLLKFADALAHLAPDVDLVVTGPIESEFKAPLRNARNLRHLERGFSDPDMQSLVGDATAAVMLSEYEGFGIPAIEAMAAGVPVVAARRGALPEVIGDAGVLVDPADSSTICEVVLALDRGEPIRSDLIESGRRRARQFTWHGCVDRVSAVLAELGQVRPPKR